MSLDPDIARWAAQLGRLDGLPPLQRLLARSSTIGAIDQAAQLPVTSADIAIWVDGIRESHRLHWPQGSVRPPLLIWFCGLDWIGCSASTHDGLCRRLSHAWQVVVVALGGPRKAERRRHGGLFAFAHRAVRALARGREGLTASPSRLLIGGDGTGAHTALQVALHPHHEDDAAMVDAYFLAHPVLRPDLNSGSWLSWRHAPLLSREEVAALWQEQLGGDFSTWDRRRIALHDGRAPQRVPIVVLGAGCDGALDDSVFLHDWLRNAHARVEFLGAPGMPHDFLRLTPVSPAAMRLSEAAFDVFRQLTALPTAPAVSKA